MYRHLIYLGNYVYVRRMSISWLHATEGQEMSEINETEKPIALVIGVTGGIGGEVARALRLRGWQVRGLVRDPAQALRRAVGAGNINLVAGDAMREADVITAALGARIIFHGANPPGYKNWRGLAIPMLRNSIMAARASGARLIFPGNVYNFGPDAGAVITEDSPQNPLTRKGRIRVEMETMLAAAVPDGVRSMIIRAGDFFGPRQPASWFKNAMVKPGRPLRAVVYPGVPNAGHAWAYLPDLAATIARLADIETTLPSFERLHFGGHWLPRGIEIAEAVARVAGKPDLPIRPFPWALLYVGAPFSTFMREALEMRYLWQVPLRLDNTKLRSKIGEETHTPLDTAIEETLRAIGCLPTAKTDRRASWREDDGIRP
jgi:nucleoside-diphosphate-sugar epimerase